MKKSTKIVSIVFILAVCLLFLLIGFVSNEFKEFGKPVYFQKQIGENLFIKEKIWGITGDNHVVIVSISSAVEFEPDSTQDYIFKTDEIYYKVENKTVYIYSCAKAKFPKIFNSEYKIIHSELNGQQMSIFKDNLKYYGVNRFVVSTNVTD